MVVESEETEPSIRRSLTPRNNAARQVAVNFMPSRQLPYNTLRLRRTSSEHNALLEMADDPDSGSSQADVIVREMEQHQLLMEDNPLSEEMRREALRDLPQGLTTKRSVRAKLSASVSLRSERRPISVFRLMKYRISFAWKRSQDKVRETIFSMSPWHEAIRAIEGQFGSAVGSYFRLVRRLLALDLAIAGLLAAFVVLPQALHDSAAGLVLAPALNNETTAVVTTEPNWAVDWITGKGGLQDSLLFYGHYHAGRAAPEGRYNIAFAYFFTPLCVLLVFFALLCYRTAYSYRRNFIETSSALSHVFANKVFCGWDFGVTDPRAAGLHSRSLHYEFKELLSEQTRKQASLPFSRRLGQSLANIVVTALVLGCIFGVLYGLWLLLERKNWEWQLSLLLTLVVAVCPALFHAVVRCEWYSPRTELFVTQCRAWLLHCGLLVLLFVYWTGSGDECWETRFAQEAYRLVLLDAVVSLFVLPAIEMLRALFYKVHPGGSPPEFPLACSSLTLVYNQAVLWLGLVFCPLLPALVAAKLLLLFYVKRACLLRACQPAKKVWRAAQAQTVLNMLVTLSLFTTLFAIGSLFLRMPSTHCGPFRDYSHVYKVASEGVLKLSERDLLSGVVRWLTKPAAIAFVLLLLCVCVYYTRARARAQRAMVQILRNMLLLQAKDKDFLLTAIDKVTNGEWLYSPKSSAGPDSHTWRYLREVRKPSNSNFHFDVSRLSRSLADRPPPSGSRPPSLPSLLADRPRSCDGDTDSSFSWQGSRNDLNTGV